MMDASLLERYATSSTDPYPTVREAFMEGNFVVQCYDKTLSMMALDQSHEHSIKFLKEDSGAKGLYGHGQQQEK